MYRNQALLPSLIFSNLYPKGGPGRSGKFMEFHLAAGFFEKFPADLCLTLAENLKCRYLPAIAC
jgi:hypothetical protein